MAFKAVLAFLIVALIGGGSLVFLHHSKKPPASTEATATNYRVRYLPLGDSYTIGQSEPESKNFPNQLVNKLKTDGVSIGILANPAVTGYTTKDLIETELPLVSKRKPTFVTILIGVNDYVQGVSIQTFQSNLEYIVSNVQKQLPNPQNIVLITVPDFGKTPSGAQFGNPTTLASGVQSFNEVIKQVATEYKLAVADIFPVSQGVASDPRLIAEDGLHPSPAEYALWTNVIYPVVKQHVTF
jgi:acyl-CoA thioesterase-1